MYMGGGLCFSVETVLKAVIIYSYKHLVSCQSKGLKMIEVPLLCEIMGQSSLLNPLLSYTAEIFFFSREYRQNKDKGLVGRDFLLTCKLPC